MQSNRGKVICVCHLQYLCLGTRRAPARTVRGPIRTHCSTDRSQWPFYCLRLAAWYIRFGPNKDGSPFCSCPSFQSLRPIFPPAVAFPSPLWLKRALKGNLCLFLRSVILFRMIPVYIFHMSHDEIILLRRTINWCSWSVMVGWMAKDWLMD